MALEPSNNSLLIGSQHIRLKRVHSTNKYALEFISKSKPMEGTVISASYQYDGRGQIGRFWESEDGKNITCSTILHPIFIQASDQFQLNMAVSLALHDLIDHFLPENHKVKIKWPNDIYVGDEKIAGILIQNTIKGKHISTSVIGTGININQVKFSDHIPNPTSLHKLVEMEIDLEIVFGWWFRFLTKRYLQLKSGKLGLLRKEYLENLYRINVWSNFNDNMGVLFTGKILGVDNDGQLKIELRDGSIKHFAFREIQFLLKNEK